MTSRNTLLSLPILTGLALAGLLLWDWGGLDLALAHASGTASGFALQDHWVMRNVMHSGARRLSWFIVIVLTVGIWWPQGPLLQLTRSQRVQLVVSTLFCAALISVLKSASVTSCPWDLSEFGGVARYLSHWSFTPDGGPGRCFPAGHASAGFAFVGGYFVFRDVAPQVARRWLAAALVAGLLLGLAQQARGAHFMSHTLWTGWLCWCAAWALDILWRVASRQPRQTT